MNDARRMETEVKRVKRERKELIGEMKDLAEEWEGEAIDLSDAGNQCSAMWNAKHARELRELIDEYE